MWYVIQTMTGQEEETQLLITTILEAQLYKECFVIKAEWLKRLGGEWQILVRPLFPGYVFIRTDCPEQIFLKLKEVPKFSRLLGSGRDEFLPLRAEEEEFLKIILNRNKEYIVKLTTVAAAADGTILAMDGILKFFEKDILRLNLHKRYAVVNVRMLGEARTILFGIRLIRDELEAEPAAIKGV